MSAQGPLTKRDQCDVAIVGGGPAGSLAAIHLAKAGVHVVLFERDHHTREKVCGEFISSECLPLLREVGVDPVALGGSDITSFRLHGPRHSVETRLPRRAIGLSRKILDEALLEKAAEAGAEIRRGVTVDEVIEGLDSPSGSILISTSEGETRSQRLIVAAGKDEFRTLNERVGIDNGYVAYQMHVRLLPSNGARLKKHSDVFVFDRGYGGFTEIENGLFNLTFLLERSFAESIENSWDSLTAHMGATCWAASRYLDGAEPLAKQFTKIENLPFGFLRRAPAPAGVLFVGDQMAVIPSMTGDGLAIALMTSRRAVEALIDEEAGAKFLRFAPDTSRIYQAEIRKTLRRQIDAAMAVHRLFRRPNLVDMSTFAIKAFPPLFSQIFKSTRCKVIASNDRSRLSSRRARALRTSAAPRA